MTINLVSLSFLKKTRWIETSAMVGLKLSRRLHRAIAQAASLPAQMVWGLSKFFLIENVFLYPKYQTALRAHQVRLPTIQGNDARIIEALEQTGLFITTLDALNLPNTPAFLLSSQKLAQGLTLKATDLEGSPHEIHASKVQLIHHPELFIWGLNQRLLEIVETYLGLPVAYDGVSCFLSLPNAQEIGARAWHRDREDRRMVKICVYLNDVNDEGGPFQCLTPALNDILCQSIKYPYKSVFQTELEQFVAAHPVDAVVNCTGPAGTVIFVDTARFYHRGKPPTQFPRTAVFFSYFSRRPWHPFFCQRTPLSSKETHLFTQTLSNNQQACVNWQAELPTIVKWIPKSQI